MIVELHAKANYLQKEANRHATSPTSTDAEVRVATIRAALFHEILEILTTDEPV